jgi:hypothetical protein
MTVLQSDPYDRRNSAIEISFDFLDRFAGGKIPDSQTRVIAYG